MVSSGVANSFISDHLPICLTVSWLFPKCPTNSFHRRSFKHFDPVLFNEEVARLSWFVLDVFDDVHDKLLVYNPLLNDAMSLHAPLESICTKKYSAPWISKSVCDEMDKRNTFTTDVSFNKTNSDWRFFTAQRNRVVTLQRQAKMQYFHSPISKNSNPAVPWKTPRSIVPSSHPLSIYV